MFRKYNLLCKCSLKQNGSQRIENIILIVSFANILVEGAQSPVSVAFFITCF